MKVNLAMYVLSASVAAMICAAIEDDDIVLPLWNKNMYNHLIVVDICNSRGGPHTPENAQERQLKLLDVLSWFTSWKMMHDNAVAEEESSTTKFNMFVKET